MNSTAQNPADLFLLTVEVTAPVPSTWGTSPVGAGATSLCAFIAIPNAPNAFVYDLQAIDHRMR